MKDKEKLIIITGPTGAGKTKISIEIAGRIGGEIFLPVFKKDIQENVPQLEIEDGAIKSIKI